MKQKTLQDFERTDYECEVCDYTTDTYQGVRTHESIVHDGYSRENTDYDHECEVDGCDFGSDSEHGLRLHLGKVHGINSNRECICDNCGDDFMAQPSDPGRYCSPECRYDGQKNRVVVECDNCGLEEERPLSRAGKTDESYCSNSCRNAYRSSDAWSGENHMNWNGGEVEIACEICGDYRSVPPSIANHERHGRFCSRECAGEAQRVDRVEIECHYCGNTSEREPWIAKRSERNFCRDTDCWKEFMSEKHSGDGNPAWEGGTPEHYGPTWEKRAAAVRERDGYECVLCGTTQEEHQEQWGALLSVHHIVPYRMFDSDAKAHADANVITLCKYCHVEMEHMTAPEQRTRIVESGGWGNT